MDHAKTTRDGLSDAATGTKKHDTNLQQTDGNAQAGGVAPGIPSPLSAPERGSGRTARAIRHPPIPQLIQPEPGRRPSLITNPFTNANTQLLMRTQAVRSFFLENKFLIRHTLFSLFPGNKFLIHHARNCTLPLFAIEIIHFSSTALF
jgi:hypothetical protein